MSVLDRTHEVLNQPPPLEDYNAFEADVPLREALGREGGQWGGDRLRHLSGVAVSAEAREHSPRAERYEPRLLTHGRYGKPTHPADVDAARHWILRVAIE